MTFEETRTFVCQRYDEVLHLSRATYEDVPIPQPTAHWPSENIDLLARYCLWLIEENSTTECINHIYLPMAGHVLGLNLNPHISLNLTTDLEKAIYYVRAKHVKDAWLGICQRALSRFRRFLRYERGLLDIAFKENEVDVSRYQQGLPTWLIEYLTHYQHIKQVNWRPARMKGAIQRFWSSHAHVWQWLFHQNDVKELEDIKRHHLLSYVDTQVKHNYAASTINTQLRCFVAILRFLQEHDFHIPLALFRIPTLRQPEPLPRFLSNEEVSRLQVDIEQRVTEAATIPDRNNALFDRAAFYLLWHCGLRIGEVEELRLTDLHVKEQRLMVRHGKGMRDRAVYLTNMAAKAIQAYLAVRGHGRTDHIFLYRHLPVKKCLIRARIKAAGKRTGVAVTPHRLRHTCATQLINAGCPITVIQTILGHKRLKATLIYARVHDRTVAEDYYAAMSVVEKRLEPHLTSVITDKGAIIQSTENNRQTLLQLLNQLETTSLSNEQVDFISKIRLELLILTTP